MDEEEYVYAYQLAMANGGDANDLSSRDSVDEESAYLSTAKEEGKSYFSQSPFMVLELLSLNLHLWSSSKQKRPKCEGGVRAKKSRDFGSHC